MATIAERFGDMDAPHSLCACQIGDRTGDAQYPDIAARGQAHGVGGLHQQFAPRFVGFGEAVERVAIQFRIAARAAVFESRCLPLARCADPCRDLGAAFGGRGKGEVCCES